MYERMYRILFNAITDRLEQMEGFNYGLATRILRKAQQEAEEVYMGKDNLDQLELAAHPTEGLSSF